MLRIKLCVRVNKDHFDLNFTQFYLPFTVRVWFCAFSLGQVTKKLQRKPHTWNIPYVQVSSNRRITKLIGSKNNLHFYKMVPGSCSRNKRLPLNKRLRKIEGNVTFCKWA